MATTIGNTRRPVATAALCTLVFLALIGGRAVYGESYLLAVEEKLNGKMSPFPWPVKEGVYALLFDQGHIVFDTKDGTPIPPLADLMAIARDGGARYILRITVTTQDDGAKAQPRRITSKAAFDLVESRSGKVVGRNETADDNAGREAAFDGMKLGQEMAAGICTAIGTFAAGVPEAKRP